MTHDLEGNEGGGNRTRATFRSSDVGQPLRDVGARRPGSSAPTQPGAHLLQAGAPGSSRGDLARAPRRLGCRCASERVLAAHARLDEQWLDAVARDDELAERRAGQAPASAAGGGADVSSARRSGQAEHRGDGAPRSTGDPRRGLTAPSTELSARRVGPWWAA
jgi:hypothetical protein